MVLNRLVSTCMLVACLAASVHFGAVSAAPPFYRNPVVLSIAPDAVDCDNPDDPDGVEDVQIAGICFRNDIASAFLSESADGTGTQIPLSNVVNVGPNIVTATVPLAQLADRDTPYYVFVVRGSDGKVSTSYPNAFGFDVTFTCATQDNDGDESAPVLTSCRVVRTGAGKLALQVEGAGFTAGQSVVLIGGEPCRKTKYPPKFINPADGTIRRLVCHDNLKQLLPDVVTVRASDGSISANSIVCGE